MSKKEHKYLHLQQQDATLPDTGAMLRDYYAKHRTHQAAVARILGRNYDTVADYKKRKSIQTAILWELCLVLKHNFFKDLAAQLPADFTSTAAKDDSLAVQVAALEQEVAVLKRERDLLKEVLSVR